MNDAADPRELMTHSPAHHHEAVLRHEVLMALAVQPQGYYLDCTFGRGGHSAAILQSLDSQGRLVALDRDPQAVCFGQSPQYPFATDPRFCIRHAAFHQLADIAAALQWVGRVQGIVFDLGVSSPQLDDPQRGFSFQKAGPLDMRMDTTADLTAAQWLAHVRETELIQCLKAWGEERFARRIAAAIIQARAHQPLTTTTELAALIADAVPTRERHQHPATRSFRAIRMAVNQELAEIEAGVKQAIAILAPGGRLAVISFHSLEDRLVKTLLRQQAGLTAPFHPASERAVPTIRLLGKQRPTAAEIATNPRARSALLRVAEKC